MKLVVNILENYINKISKLSAAKDYIHTIFPNLDSLNLAIFHHTISVCALLP